MPSLILPRFPDAEEPPAGLFLSPAGLSFEVDFHGVFGRRDHLEPVFADIPLGAAVVALSRFPPGPEDRFDRDRLSPPEKLPWKSGFSDGHARGVTRGNHGDNGFTDKPLRHDQSPPDTTVEGGFR